MEKNNNVSTKDPINDDVNGAANQILLLNLSKIKTSNNCANKNAVPDPIAIRIEIRSEKFVEKNKVNNTP